MRYQMAESNYLAVSFPTGKTVTITVYKLSDSSVIVNAAAMTEIGSTGIYKYLFAPAPAVATQYVYIATDGFDTRTGKIVLGGYPDTISASQTSEESSISTINGNIATILADCASILASQGGEEADIATILGNIASILASQAGEEANVAIILSRVPVIGPGAIAWGYALTDSVSGLPIADAEVWITTDLAGANVVAAGTTDQNGSVSFMLDAGTVYVWRAKTGYSFDNPDTEVVS